MDAAMLERRLVELETRLAFQEHAMAELSDALADTRLEAARQSERLLDVLQELKMSRGAMPDNPDPASEPPPPHY
jgi:SlyX protein